MQGQEYATARRPLDVEDYIDILRRHKSWIFGPAFAALVIATVVAFLWPDTYIASGIIRVVPPQVPESYVPSNLNTDLQGRLNSMIQGVLNKTTLISIINKYDLYKKERNRMPMEDVVENMREHDIRIGAVQSFTQVGNSRIQYPTFEVGFAYSNRFVAAKVAQEIMGQILDENLRETATVTQRTTDFLKTNWEQAKKRLDAIEGQISAFREKNMGHLPDQQMANFEQMNAIQTELLNLNTAMSRVNQDKLVLENQMRIYKDQLSQLKDPAPQDVAVQKKNEKLAEKEREISYYEDALAAARERYKESHPDVQNLIAKVATAKKQRDDLLKEEANKKPEPVLQRAPSPEFVRQQQDLDVAVKRLQGSIEAKDLEMQDYQKQQAQLTKAMQNVQERLQGTPSGLKEYEDLMRERDLAKKDYEDLDNKVRNSDLATKVISNQQGERLEQLEEATPPQTPTEPKRPIIILAGTGLGLLIGLFMAGAREIKNTSLKNLKDVRAYTQLPILGSIPLLENDLVVRRRRRLAWLAWATACLLGVILMSTSVVYYYSTKL